jgi:protein-disulfide isomerase
MTAQASNSPAGARAAGDGIVIGDGPVTVDAYVDYLCPYCRDFEISAGPALSSLVADGAITLVYHPMSFLDQASTTHYSSRAASAAGCAADQGKFLEYTHALFGSQPPEGGAASTTPSSSGWAPPPAWTSRPSGPACAPGATWTGSSR